MLNLVECCFISALQSTPAQYDGDMSPRLLENAYCWQSIHRVKSDGSIGEMPVGL
jgi:hypothetical protein